MAPCSTRNGRRWNAVLVQALKRDASAGWRAEASRCGSPPDYFRADGDAPSFLPWRATAASTRGVADRPAGAPRPGTGDADEHGGRPCGKSRTEAALPALRDALILRERRGRRRRDRQGALDHRPSADRRAVRIGAVEDTGQQAIETVQGLISGVRTGQISNAYPALALAARTASTKNGTGSARIPRGGRRCWSISVQENLLLPSLRDTRRPPSARWGRGCTRAAGCLPRRPAPRPPPLGLFPRRVLAVGGNVVPGGHLEAGSQRNRSAVLQVRNRRKVRRHLLVGERRDLAADVLGNDRRSRRLRQARRLHSVRHRHGAQLVFLSRGCWTRVSRASPSSATTSDSGRGTTSGRSWSCRRSAGATNRRGAEPERRGSAALFIRAPAGMYVRGLDDEGAGWGIAGQRRRGDRRLEGFSHPRLSHRNGEAVRGAADGRSAGRIHWLCRPVRSQGVTVLKQIDVPAAPKVVTGAGPFPMGGLLGAFVGAYARPGVDEIAVFFRATQVVALPPAIPGGPPIPSRA